MAGFAAALVPILRPLIAEAVADEKMNGLPLASLIVVISGVVKVQIVDVQVSPEDTTGGLPAPPPSIISVEVSNADEAQVLVDEK